MVAFVMIVLDEINARCQVSNVSGVTIAAISRNTRRPSARAFAASRRR
jgi:hypothetical protein